MKNFGKTTLWMLGVLALGACSSDPQDPEALELDDGADAPAASPVTDAPLALPTGGQALVPGFDVSIAKSGPDIALQWSDQATADYEIWTSDDAYFAPGDAGSSMLGMSGGLLSYTDAGGNDDIDRYYRVVAVGAADPLSTTVGKLAYDLEPGYTKLGLCLISEVDTSAELADDMESALISTHVWNEASQDWEWSLAGDPPPGLGFGVGEAISVRHDLALPVTPSTYTMVGLVPTADDVAIDLLPGDNLVTMLPLRFGDIMASTLLPQINFGERVGIWDAASQQTLWYPDDGDFLLPRCSPVHVEVSAPSPWPPPAPEPLLVTASPSCTNYLGAPVPLEAIVSGGYGDYSYTWEPDDGSLSSTDQATTLASPAGIQSYTVTVDDGVSTAADSALVVDNDAFDLLNSCTLYQGSFFPPTPLASISYDEDGTRACELGNNDFGLHLCEGVVFEDVQLVGQLEVLAGTGDDDFMGLVWGAQDNANFYSLSWKAATQGVYPGGIVVKRIHAPSFASLTDDDIYIPADTPNSTLLLAPAQTTTAGWVAGQSFTVTINYQTTGSDITVVRDSDGLLIASFSVTDTTYPQGFFGSTTASQANACVGPLFASCL